MNEAPKLPTLAAGGRALAIVPQNFEEAFRIGRAVVEAGMAPREINTAAKATVIILHGLEVGLTPMAALQSIAMINGKPSLYGDGLLGVVRASGLLEWIEESEADSVARCRIKRRGEPVLERTFSVADAKRAGLWAKAGPWSTYPDRMLLMRARGFALRDAFADVLRGIISREEAEDIPARTGNGNRPPPAAVQPQPERDNGPPTPPPATIAREDGRERPDGPAVTDDELVAEIEAGRDDGSTVEWVDEQGEVHDVATADDVLDPETFLAELDLAYARCELMAQLFAAKKQMLMPVFEQLAIPDRLRAQTMWKDHGERIARVHVP